MIHIYIQFQEILVSVTVAMATLQIFNHFRGINSCNTDAAKTKLKVNCPVLTKHTCLKFHEVPLVGYLETNCLFVDCNF